MQAGNKGKKFASGEEKRAKTHPTEQISGRATG